MPRGRPAAPKAPTKFLNSKRRTIYMTANGKYIAKSEKGATVYNPKARHVKSPGGTVRSLLNSGARVPTAIRPKMTRARRSNSGKARGPRAYKSAAMGVYYKHPIGPKRRGRPRKHMVSPKAGLGLGALFKSLSGGKLGPVARRYKATLARKTKLARKRAAKKTPMERLMASLN